jgi:hypothetical protein
MHKTFNVSVSPAQSLIINLLTMFACQGGLLLCTSVLELDVSCKWLCLTVGENQPTNRCLTVWSQANSWSLPDITKYARPLSAAAATLGTVHEHRDEGRGPHLTVLIIAHHGGLVSWIRKKLRIIFCVFTLPLRFLYWANYWSLFAPFNPSAACWEYL